MSDGNVTPALIRSILTRALHAPVTTGDGAGGDPQVGSPLFFEE